jgi:hypothetical protein
MAKKTEPKKRQLKYQNFDEMMADVNSLLGNGYVSNGNWTLAQACGHVSDWMRFPIDGYPTPPLFMRVIFWIMKVTAGPGMKRKILAEGFKGGLPTAPETVPKPNAMSDRQAVDQLQKTVDRVLAYDGELLPSPLFGKTDKETHIKVSLLHAEHHFGYLEPK